MPRKKTYEEVKKEVESLGLVLLSKEYVNSTTPMKYRCPCGNEFERVLKSMKRKGSVARCEECVEVVRRERGRVFNENTIDTLMNKYNLTLLTDKKSITKVKTPLDVKCSCGKKFRTDIYNLRQGNSTKCKSCNSFSFWEENKKTIDDVKKIVSQYGGTLLEEEYIDNKTKMLIQCECGTKFKRKLNSIMNYESARCNLCSEKILSKGELKISNILKYHNIDFLTQHTFDDLRLVHKLKFDFYIKNINTCIEFDGKQHYQPVEKFGGEEEFEVVKARDTMKNEYCKNNNIKLLRIPYWEFKNIENILIENKIIPSQAS